MFYGYWVLLISVILHALGAGEFFYESGDRRRGVLKVVRGLALVMIVPHFSPWKSTGCGRSDIPERDHRNFHLAVCIHAFEHVILPWIFFMNLQMDTGFAMKTGTRGTLGYY